SYVGAETEMASSPGSHTDGALLAHRRPVLPAGRVALDVAHGLAIRQEYPPDDGFDQKGGAVMADDKTVRPYVRRDGDGEALWFLGNLVTVKATGAQTRDRVTVVEFVNPPGFAPPLH